MTNYNIQGFAITNINVKNPYMVVLVSTNTQATLGELNIIPYSKVYDENLNIEKIEFDTSKLKHSTISTSSFSMHTSYLAQPMQISENGTLIGSRIGHQMDEACYFYLILINVQPETLDIKYETKLFSIIGGRSCKKFLF